MMVKLNCLKQSLLIVFDFYPQHYQILLIIFLRFIQKSVVVVKKIENSDFEYCFVKLNNDDKLVYKCGECNTEWEEQLDHKLIENFPGVYEFCEVDLEKFVLLLRKGVCPYEYMDSWQKFE